MQYLNLKKFFLYLLIVSVAVSAVLGIGVLLFGNFGEREARILGTTSIITAASILGLACGAFYETGRGRILPVGGIVFSILTAVLWIIFIWDGTPNERVFIKVAFTATILAISCSHLSLLSIARLERKFLWSRYVAHAAVWLLATILLYIIWVDPRSDSDLIVRINGVLSIIITAITILTPIFHRLSAQLPDTGAIDAEIERLKARIEELERQKAEIKEEIKEEKETPPGDEEAGEK